MKIKYPFILVLIIYLSTSCSSSQNTTEEKNVILSSLYHKTEKANLFYKLPKGWTEVQDNYERLFELWLVGNKGKSSIIFTPIQLENELVGESVLNQLRRLSTIESNIKKASLTNYSTIGKLKEFSSNDIQFISRKYIDGNSTKRSVVFGKGKLFYKCIAFFENDYNATADELKNLFKIQQYVLNSLQLKEPIEKNIH